jgi:hypothetical protein
MEEVFILRIWHDSSGVRATLAPVQGGETRRFGSLQELVRYLESLDRRKIESASKLSLAAAQP